MPLDTRAAVPMPTFFIPHGAGPCFFMEWNPPDAWDGMAAFLRGLAATLPRRPQAIVMVSAHWRAPEGFRVTGQAHPALFYDYHGFPPHTYELQYPAPGHPALAQQVAQLIAKSGMAVAIDEQRDFDHGMFIPLKLVYPEADVPVIQLSLRSDLDTAAHLAVGQALASLREQDVLIIGSGMSFHNMRAYGDKRYTPISQEFDRWLTAAVEAPPAERGQLLRQWERAPRAQQCHPPGGEEHFTPLLVAAGAGHDAPGKKIYSEVVMETQLSAYRFG